MNERACTTAAERPAAGVAADLSSRHDGWPQAQAFVAELLSRHRGVATDDDQKRLWTRDEVAKDQVPEGLPFGAWRPRR